MPNCLVETCMAEANASRGWCWKHYNRWRRNGDPLAGFQQSACSVEDCAADSRAGGMCDMHYRRAKKYGDPNTRLLMRRGQCTADDCSRKAFGKGLCSTHYYPMWVENGGRAVMAAASARRRAAVVNAPEVDHSLSWLTLWHAGQMQCYLCGITCDPADYGTIINRAGRSQKICGPRHPTLDHVVPLSRGGSHTLANAALACRQCNCKKWASVGRKAQAQE